mgnify:CR=1 FL=1
MTTSPTLDQIMPTRFLLSRDAILTSSNKIIRSSLFMKPTDSNEVLEIINNLKSIAAPGCDLLLPSIL